MPHLRYEIYLKIQLVFHFHSICAQDFEKFLNESKDGVVYFSMGSLLRGESFPEEKRNAFLYAFSKIPQRVLWKWEGDELPGKADNIRISKWMPQRDIFGMFMKKVELFDLKDPLNGASFLARIFCHSQCDRYSQLYK